MTDARRRLGRRGEDIAALHLERRGFEIVARNVRTRHGEIDLIGFDGDVLAFVEVKALRARPRLIGAGAAAPTSKGLPAAAHDPQPLAALSVRQRLRLRRLATAWLADSCSPSAREIRFDAIGVVVDLNDRLLRLEHIEGAW
jgi:putative endonuclease